MTKFSIVMPVYNAGNELKRSIGSVLNQTYENWELIIINDGSTDNTLEVANSIAQIDDRVKIFSQDNSGPGAARNNGISKCTGDFVAFIDSDDYYDSEFLMSVNTVNEISSKDIIFVDFVNEDKNGKVYDCSNIYSLRNKKKNELLSMQMTGLMPWGPVVKVSRLEIAKKFSFSNIDVGEEAVFSFDLLSNCSSIGFVEKPLYHYVHNDSGQHTKGGLDPWWIVVESMNEHLIACGNKTEFESSINSFALRALCINQYRCACNYYYKDALQEMKKSYLRYKKKYDFTNLNLNALDKKSLMILWCLRSNAYLIIYLASKLRRG